MLKKIREYLTRGGFPSIYLDLPPSDEIKEIKEPFAEWQKIAGFNKNLTIIYGGDKDTLLKFATCCARLFIINNYSAELITANDIKEGYFGKAFFVVVDNADLLIDIQKQFYAFLDEKFKERLPVLLIFNNPDVISFLNKILSPYEKFIIALEIGG